MGNINISKTTAIRILLSIVAVAAIIFLISMSRYFFPKEEKILAPPLIKPEDVVYNTCLVQKSFIENRFIVRGNFIPEKQIDISFSNRDGHLKSLNVKAGQMVTREEILATLDTDTLKNEIKRQTLLLKGAEDILAKLNKISVLDIGVNRLQLDELKKELEIKNLQKSTFSRMELEKLENQVTIEEQMLDKLSIDYEYQISAAERDIEMIRLELSDLELELEKSTMRAPITGKVNYVAYVNEGEYIPTYKTIVSIADSDFLVLRYNGREYSNFRMGMQVNVKIEEKVYSGEVVLTPLQVPYDDYEKMKETIHIRVKDIPAKVDIDDSASVEVILERADDVIVLPKKLVHQYIGRLFVKILENGIVNERDIEIGIQSSTAYEITSGLEVGELVVE